MQKYKLFFLMFFTLVFGDNFKITNLSEMCFVMKVVEKNDSLCCMHLHSPIE